jgi:aryl-alcohol dehydrogenase-like predicted oxidoreductase
MTVDLRPLGRTGLTVSRIGLGLAALGRPAYINLGHGSDLGADRSVEILERRAHEVLDAAYAAGVRYFDVARSYGLAEAFLSSWLDRLEADPTTITIGSKWGYTYVGDWRVDAEVHEVKDHSVDNLRRQFAESRELLGDWLSLYQIHSVTPESGVLNDQAVLEELMRVRELGVVVGLTTSGPRQGDAVMAALGAEVHGANPFMSVQATWNLLEQSAGEALATAHRSGWGVIIKEAVANGRLTPRGSDLNSAEQHGLLGRLAQRHGVDIDALAVAAATAQPWVDVVLSGAAKVEHLHSNLRALNVSLHEADLAELMKLREAPNDYWDRRAGLQWD